MSLVANALCHHGEVECFTKHAEYNVQCARQKHSLQHACLRLVDREQTPGTQWSYLHASCGPMKRPRPVCNLDPAPTRPHRALQRNLSAFSNEDAEHDPRETLPMPMSLVSTFRWAFHILDAFVCLMGENTVKHRLRHLRWRVSTFFTGMDCVSFALSQLDAACVEKFGCHMGFEHGTSCEINQQCQQWLLQRFPDRCLFGDVLDFPVVKPDIDQWRPEDLRLNSAHYCLAHKRHCSRDRSATDVGRIDVDVSGPPCVLFSTFGKHEGLQNHVKARVHSVWLRTKQLDGWPLIVHENVPQYPEDRQRPPCVRFKHVWRALGA